MQRVEQPNTLRHVKRHQKGVFLERSKGRAGLDRMTNTEGSTSASRMQFGAFEVAIGENELRKRGIKIKLQDKPFQILVLLLERAGQIVTREDMRDRLWPADTFVDFDANLNTALKKLRQALGDSADNPIFIETIPRQGYRFIAPVENVQGPVEAAGASSSKPTPGSPDFGWITGVLSSRRRRTVALILLIFAGLVAAFYIRREVASRRAKQRTGGISFSMMAEFGSQNPPWLGRELARLGCCVRSTGRLKR
jgi:DNA-binding winged helix-turn-helix (wHTH) protein